MGRAARQQPHTMRVARQAVKTICHLFSLGETNMSSPRRRPRQGSPCRPHSDGYTFHNQCYRRHTGPVAAARRAVGIACVAPRQRRPLRPEQTSTRARPSVLPMIRLLIDHGTWRIPATVCHRAPAVARVGAFRRRPTEPSCTTHAYRLWRLVTSSAIAARMAEIGPIGGSLDTPRGSWTMQPVHRGEYRQDPGEGGAPWDAK